MMKKYFFGTILLLTYACTKDVGKPVVTCNIPQVISYSSDIQKIFNESCALSGCHSGNNPAGNLNLDASVSYQQLMQNGSGYVDTIQPNFSLLYAQMNSVSNPMPPSGKLDACRLDAVLRWIQQKAKNN